LLFRLNGHYDGVRQQHIGTSKQMTAQQTVQARNMEPRAQNLALSDTESGKRFGGEYKISPPTFSQIGVKAHPKRFGGGPLFSAEKRHKLKFLGLGQLLSEQPCC